jgi:hypothetical protein
MRLLNASTLQLETFAADIPKYAILSHTWEDEELLFEDLDPQRNPVPCRLSSGKQTLGKVLHTCEQARRDGLDYVWVDTCCIDKSSSAELSEAINSMFKWYCDANLCYAFLSDVEVDDDSGSIPAGFLKSRWFTRGWTLQELIAPGHLRFYDNFWVHLGDRHKLAAQIEQITRVDRDLLRRESTPGGFGHLMWLLQDHSVATRMNWAAGRHTTRIEDVAYSLLGLFDIHMPLLYGEGEKSFARLQEEIIRAEADQSILAWKRVKPVTHRRGGSSFQLLASSPDDFPKPMEKWSFCGDYPTSGTPLSISSLGISATVRLYRCTINHSDFPEDIADRTDYWTRFQRIPYQNDVAHNWDDFMKLTCEGGRNARWPGGWVAILDCAVKGRFLTRPGILLRRVSQEELIFSRWSPSGSLLEFTHHSSHVGGCVEVNGIGKRSQLIHSSTATIRASQPETHSLALAKAWQKSNRK